MVKILKEGNCVTMGFGLESADNGILKSMRKGITIEQIEKALKLFYDSGIAIQGGFIFGDIEETLETATNTINWWKEHPQYGISLNFITTYPGTGLYKYACKNGIIKDEVQFIKDGCPTINVSKMSSEERAWLAEQIVMLPQSELKKPKNIEEVKINYSNARVSFKGECLSCGSENNWNDVRFFTRNVLTCSECGRKHKIPIFDMIIEAIDASIDLLLNKHGKIAFWGINDYFSDLSKHLKEASNSNIYYVDISKMKQGSKLSGKIIC
ncbi:radical SAM protein [Clostridium saccharobutylicum]|uniref:Radical SAM superfamily protein n=1 Tax=Clostridium saccharobutylicum TaxID=169679 RepID=A0A1S8NIQ8_CLOSA|nr:radical SAM superfamily protein [Clostridium saccharobutylicum]